jgi:predicted nucleotidyltransferase component of viral defense system
MISRTRLRQIAREFDVRLGYAEKNYVNSWMLWAIYTGSYGENLLFKGGTALSKLYFPETWRYSEDLDFGVDGQYRGSQDDLEAALDTASRASGIDFDVTKHMSSAWRDIRHTTSASTSSTMRYSTNGTRRAWTS